MAIAATSLTFITQSVVFSNPKLPLDYIRREGVV
jgi:hypothetical protein